MSTRLHLRCDGCFKETEGGYLRKTFQSVSGRSHGIGAWQMPDLEKAVPDGWVWSDPYTSCTYCPECWAGIIASNRAQMIAEECDEHRAENPV